MSLPYKSDLIPLAKNMRKHATPQENHLWYDFLRSYPIRFQRQKAIDHYIVDFYCHAAKLVIEIDGSQHYDPKLQAEDEKRTAELQKLGLSVDRPRCEFQGLIISLSPSVRTGTAPSKREPICLPPRKRRDGGSLFDNISIQTIVGSSILRFFIFLPFFCWTSLGFSATFKMEMYR